MTKKSLNLSGKINQSTVELLDVIDSIARNLGITYLVVGATARDLVLHYGFGAAIKRATTDVDFGLQIDSWHQFEKLKSNLVEHNFKETKLSHRLIDPNGTQVDIVPFGKLEDEHSNINWPADSGIEMSVLGFQEACDHAIDAIIGCKNSEITIPVASPQGFVLLKLISWNERNISIRKKDAEDFVYSIESYELVDNVQERLYEEDGLMEKYDYEIGYASAHLLGKDSAAIASDKTIQKIKEILSENINPNESNRLVEEMCLREDEYDKKLKYLEAFSKGFGI